MSVPVFAESSSAVGEIITGEGYTRLNEATAPSANAVLGSGNRGVIKLGSQLFCYRNKDDIGKDIAHHWHGKKKTKEVQGKQRISGKTHNVRSY